MFEKALNNQCDRPKIVRCNSTRSLLHHWGLNTMTGAAALGMSLRCRGRFFTLAQRKAIREVELSVGMKSCVEFVVVLHFNLNAWFGLVSPPTLLI
jgi:hypothetical protein